MMNKLEIIEETVKYYSEDTSRRGREVSGLCSYYTEDGKMCAVGRVLKNAEDFQRRVDASSWGSIDMLVLSAGFNIEDDLKDEYKGHEIEFWEDLQSLHDACTYWNGEGITQHGLNKVELLNMKYNEDK